MTKGFTSRVPRYIYLLVLIFGLVLLYPASKTWFSTIGERWLYILLLSFVISFCFTPIFRSLAIRWNLLDKPDARKIHKQPTPLLGGAPVFLAFTAGILVNGIYTCRLTAILAGATLVFAVGVIDDFRELRASVKLIVQFLATLLIIFFGVVLRVFPEGQGLFAQIANVMLTVFWVVGITNAMNFFDGMDGLATGLGFILSLFLGVVAFQTGQAFLGWVSVAMMGSCLGFLPYNFRTGKSASIFLGDGGSTLIGYVLACLAVYGDWSESNRIVSLASPLLIFWILIFDMIYISLDRIFTGRVLNFRQWIEYVGRDHLHHRLFDVLGSAKKTVLFIYLISFTLGTSAVVLRNARTIDAILLLIQAMMIVVILTILERRGRFLAESKGKTSGPGEALYKDLNTR